jgi:hypothetical protein
MKIFMQRFASVFLQVCTGNAYGLFFTIDINGNGAFADNRKLQL